MVTLENSPSKVAAADQPFSHFFYGGSYGRGVACLLMPSSHFESLLFEAAGSLICLNTRLALDVGVVRTGELAARKRDEHGRVLAVQAILVAELLDQIVLF